MHGARLSQFSIDGQHTRHDTQHSTRSVRLLISRPRRRHRRIDGRGARTRGLKGAQAIRRKCCERRMRRRVGGAGVG